MRIIAQFVGVNKPIEAAVTSHIHARWPRVTINIGGVEASQDSPQAVLVIASRRPVVNKEKWLFRETIEVEGMSPEEVLFLVDAKLGKLTKAKLLNPQGGITFSSPVSRRDFLSGAFRKHTQPNDAPVVLPDSCEVRFGCRKCVEACPAPGALTIEDKSVVVSSDRCIRCGLCAGICPVAAVQIPSMPEEAYRGLLAAIENSPAPRKTLVVTCDDQSIRQTPWVDIEEVPGVGFMGVRQTALAASSRIDNVIVYCADGMCAGKENAKRAATLISSLSSETTSAVTFIEGKDGATQIEQIHNSARQRVRTEVPPATPWEDYVNSIKSIASGQTQATGLGFTDIRIADSCTLCNACSDSCPHQALAIQEGELIFYQEKCTGCGYCQQICPERSITLTEKTSVLTLDAKAVYKDEMIKCTRCSAPFISAKMLNKVFTTLETSQEVLRLCPSCRRTEAYQNIFGNNSPNSKNYEDMH